MKLRLLIFGIATLFLGACGARKQQLSSSSKILIATAEPQVSDSLAADSIVDSLALQQALFYQASAAGLRKEATWSPAIHYDHRKPNFVIIHHTAQESLAQTVRTFTLAHTKVSAHYVIGKNGEVVQMLNDYQRAWHAGAARWGNITDLNSVSLGIELDNNGVKPFPALQINALIRLLDSIKTQYNIPTANFIGHADIAPTRKNDPSALFPWKELADHGFGYWYEESKLETPPANFNAVDALRIMGYDTRNLKAAIIAFKRKYIIKDLSPELSIFDQSVLYNLYKKY